MLKKRAVLAGICVVISLACLFGLMGFVNSQKETVTVLQTNTKISRGDEIDTSKLTPVQLSKVNLPQEYVINPKSLEGKIALTDIYPKEFISSAEVAMSLKNSEEKLLKLDGTRVAISINLKNFAQGLSDKILGGDIVSVIVSYEGNDDGITEIPVELTYMEVIATTKPSGIDKANSDDVGEGSENITTATLLATPLQAQLLARYDKEGEIHLALAYRGDEEKAKVFLDKQNEMLNLQNLVTSPYLPETEGLTNE